MRVPLWVAALSGVLGVGAVGGYYVALWQQQQYQVLLLGAVALAILAWLGSGADLLGLLRELYKDRKEAEEK
jgi:ABC-type proline/glycine betaine transport system permease subunit